MKIPEFDAIVIGGGPAGLMAAGRAAERGRKVLLLEKNDILGKKLLISGKGRCNVSHAGDVDEYMTHFSTSGRFLRNTFARVFCDTLFDFFEKRGVPLIIERGRRVFPASGRAKDILDALRGYAKENGVRILLKSEAEDIIVVGDGLKRVILSGGQEYSAQAVAVCTGGVSYPQTGSTGFGFSVAKRLGHRVIAPTPALVPLVAASSIPRQWQGLSLRNVEAALICNGARKTARFGDALFTHFGLSGPIILDMSAEVFDCLQGGKEVHIRLNLKPALDRKKLDERLIKELSKHSNKTVKNVLRNLLPAKMVEGFIKICDLNADVKAHRVTKQQRARILNQLSGLSFKIVRTRPMEEAIVTRGGVDTRQINPKTMESRLIKGLFFAGEVIDVDAKSGGFNMQAAFSTGYICGDNL